MHDSGSDAVSEHSTHGQKRSLNHVPAAKPANVVGDDTTGDQYWTSFHERFSPEVELHSLIGISLSFGFIFMLIVDNICGGGHSHGSSGKIIHL